MESYVVSLGHKNMKAIQTNLILDQRIFLALDIKKADPANITSQVGWEQGNTYINNTR